MIEVIVAPENRKEELWKLYQDYAHELSLYDGEKRRRGGAKLKYGDESTFFLLTRPYQDEVGNWKAPLSPRTEWLHHLGPRLYRFGVRFDL